MDRRSFLTASAAAIVTAPLAVHGASETKSSNAAKFKLKYAPNFGSFSKSVGSKDPLDHIKFIADQGFRAIFDNGMMGKPPEVQEKIAKELARQGMDLGPFVFRARLASGAWVRDVKENYDLMAKGMQASTETAKRTNCKWVLVVPGGFDKNMKEEEQTANVVANLKRCCDVLEKSGLIIVIEPLNPMNHPGRFLTRIPQALAICKAVNHPCCKIVNDLYHQQITEGNLIPNIDKAWEHIAAFHLGDTPGRKEPGTGEINYKNVLKHVHKKGYDGVLCMEHGRSIKGIEGEEALIAAYREADSFEV